MHKAAFISLAVSKFEILQLMQKAVVSILTQETHLVFKVIRNISAVFKLLVMIWQVCAQCEFSSAAAAPVKMLRSATKVSSAGCGTWLLFDAGDSERAQEIRVHDGERGVHCRGALHGVCHSPQPRSREKVGRVGFVVFGWRNGVQECSI